MTTSDFEELKRKLEGDFRLAEAEYLANLAAVDRVLALSSSTRLGGERAKKPAKASMKTAIGEVSGKGALLNAIRGLIKDLPTRFTWKDVISQLQKGNSGVEFKEPSVRQAVMRLVTLGEISIAEQGKGRAPSIYKRKD